MKEIISLQSLKKRGQEKNQAEKVLVAGFALLILIGAVLLSLPQATIRGRSIGFVRALFTATSATCVTGLSVVDTATTFNLFGKSIILMLIQIGGLGFMLFGTFIMVILGRRISLKNRALIRDTFNTSSLSGVVRLSLKVVVYALTIEAIGAVILSIRFIKIYGFIRGIAYGIFHSISAFCNAGFDLIGNYQSFNAYSTDPLVLITLSFLIVFGGLGFIVINELLEKKLSFRKFSLHSKIVLLSTAVLIVVGTILIFLTEFDNKKLWGDNEFNFSRQLLNSFFYSTTLRTAGFSSFNLSRLSHAGKFISLIFMFIGASPTSTGGGIKTTTAFLLALQTWHVIRGEQDLRIFRKTVASKQSNRALSIVIISFLAVSLATAVICFIERTSNIQFIDLVFETVSAIATVGLSSASTPNLSSISTLVLIPIMFIGRVGPLTLGIALSNVHVSNNKIQYPEERILIG